MKRRTLVAFSAAVGATLIGVYGSSFRAHAPPATVAAAGESSAVAVPSSLPLVRIAATPGDRRVYETDFTETVTLASEVGSAPSQIALVKRVRASWSVTCTAVEGGRVRYRAFLEGVSLWANGESLPSEAQTCFRRPFFFETTPEGRVLSVAFDTAADADARGVLKALVAASQIVFPKDNAAGDRWLSQEEDPTGEYEARYTREGASTLRKARTRYTRVATDKGMRDVGEVGELTVNDDTKLELGPDGRLRAVVSTTDTDMNLGQGMPRARAVSTLSMRLASSTSDTTGLTAMNEEWARKQKVGIAAGQDDPKTKEAMQREAEEGVLKKATFADLQRDLAATPPTSSKERSTQMFRFQADFRLHPEDTQNAVRYVRTASVADGRTITGALGGAATPEALKALADIADSRATPQEVRVNAIGALAINPTPSSSSVQALKAMTSDGDADIRAASTLALGGAARTLGSADQGAYEDAVRALTRGMSAAQSPEEKILYLRALGNAGDPRVVALAEQAMTDAAAEVRVAAVVSVRFVPGPIADEVLTRAMQSDTDAMVRMQAVATAEGYRSLPGYLVTFSSLMQSDPEALVRRGVLHALNGMRALPEAMALIHRAAESDPSEDNRQVAKAIVDAARTVSQN